MVQGCWRGPSESRCERIVERMRSGRTPAFQSRTEVILGLAVVERAQAERGRRVCEVLAQVEGVACVRDGGVAPWGARGVVDARAHAKGAKTGGGAFTDEALVVFGLARPAVGDFLWNGIMSGVRYR